MPRINIPPVTRILLGTLFALSFLSAAIRYKQWTSSSDTILIPYLNLIPQLSLLYPWTFLTTTLVESNVFTFTIAALTLYQGGRYLERAWSSKEFAKFVLISALVPNVLCYAMLIIFFALTRNESWGLTPVAGTIPLQISFLIAFSQLVPAHTVTVFRGLLSLRVPRFPLLYLALVLLLALTPLLSAAAFLLALFGFLTAFTYLRFFKLAFPDLDASQAPYTAGGAALRGDAAETFAFAEFFPGPAKPFVATAADAVFDVLVSLRLCAPFPQSGEGGAHGGGYQQSGHRSGAPGSARAEAERRRALALKALDQRLHAATAGRAGGSGGGGASSSSHNGSSSNVNRALSPVPPSSAAAPAAPLVTGPTVQDQPANSQTAMTSRPSDGMLGEMNYNPDDEGGDKSQA